MIRFWSWSVDFPPFSSTLTYWNWSNSGFLGISQRRLGGNSLKCCMLMYPGHLQNWLDCDHSLLIFSFWLGETGQLWDYRAFTRKRMVGMVWNFACWCIPDYLQNWLDCGHGLWIFFILAPLWHSELVNFRFPGIFLRPYWRSSLNFGILVYLDHLQNWLDFGHILLIFLFLAPILLNETGQTLAFCAFSSECVLGITWNLVCWCIVTTSRTDYILVVVCLFSPFWHYFDLVKLVKFEVSGPFLENTWEVWTVF